jgi:pyruvate dehydrogenase E2 component (dihydrolipoamide acetyltransferase)
MSEQEIKVPDLGGADEVEVIEITVSAGDSVETEDPILTVESDKASVELPSPGAGKITKITVKVGDKVKEGDVVGMMEASAEGGGSGDAGSDDSEAKPEEKAEEKSEAKQEQSSEESKPAPKKASGGSRKETVKVPALDGFDNVPVIEINVAEGDSIDADDPLVTVESDKATMEIPSPYAGKVGKILVSEGDKLSEGDELLEMTVQEEGGDEEEASESASEESTKEEKSEPKPEEKPKQEAESKPEPQGATYEAPTPGAKVHAGPAVRKIARELGADLPASRVLAPRGGF